MVGQPESVSCLRLGGIERGGALDASKIPLVINFEGALLATNISAESFLSFSSEGPRNIARALRWLSENPATLAAKILSETEIDFASIPSIPGIHSMAILAANEGRHVVLTTQLDGRFARDFAASRDYIHEVVTVDRDSSNSGLTISEILKDRFGEAGFDYVGRGVADLPLLQVARTVYLLNPSRKLAKKAASSTGNLSLIYESPNVAQSLFQIMRPHQWSKNLLLLVPAVAAGTLFFQTLSSLIAAIILFSLSASSAYVINDMLDIQRDRAHPRKRHRPLAAGRLTLSQAIILALALLSSAVVFSSVFFGALMTTILIIHVFVTVFYSLFLKKVALVDVFVLSGLYGLRILAGAVAAEIPLSLWLIVFSIFAFLSLALSKRLAELLAASSSEVIQANGRGYKLPDSPLVLGFGVSSGFTAGVVLALYAEDPVIRSMYSNPDLLWFVVPLWLYWISRIWMLTHRGDMLDDPVLFTLKDPQSYLVGAGVLVTILFAR